MEYSKGDEAISNGPAGRRRLPRALTGARNDGAPARIVALGSFPPPRTGQSVVTEVVCAALEREAEVTRIDVSRGMRAWRSGFVGARDRLGDWIGAIRDLRAAMKNQEADIFYFTPAASQMGTLRDVVTLLIVGRTPRIVAHTHAGSMGAHLSRSRIARWVAGRCDRILSPSTYAAASIRTSMPGADVRVVYNPIAPELRFTREEVHAKWKRVAHEPPSVLFLGNMIPGKGFGDLVSAVLRLRVPVQVVLAGEWADERDRVQFERRLDALEIAEQVRITGTLSVESVRDVLLGAAVMVHPSRMRHESAPLVLLEAMAAGCGVVSYDHAGSGELVGEAGLLVAAGDIDDLVAAIERVLEEPKLWGRRARARYERVFEPDELESAVVREILSLSSHG